MVFLEDQTYRETESFERKLRICPRAVNFLSFPLLCFGILQYSSDWMFPVGVGDIWGLGFSP